MEARKPRFTDITGALYTIQDAITNTPPDLMKTAPTGPTRDVFVRTFRYYLKRTYGKLPWDLRLALWLFERRSFW